MINMCNNPIEEPVAVTGQSVKEKEFLKEIQEKNLNRVRLPRGPRK